MQLVLQETNEGISGTIVNYESLITIVFTTLKVHNVVAVLKH